MVHILVRVHTDNVLSRYMEYEKMKAIELQFMFCFPRAATPTEEELERMEDYIRTFYDLRNNLESFVLARA